jgi:cholesterol transport system auxiliary component
MRTILGIINAVCLISLFSGCSLSPVKTQPVSSYQLNTDRSNLHRYRDKHQHVTLFLSQPSANAGYQNNGMIYVTAPYELHAYVYNQWVDSPANMMLNVLTDHLQQSNAFKAVTFSPTTSLSDFRLDTQIIIFQQEFLKQNSQFRLVIQATLSNVSTHKVIASKRFEAIIDAPLNNPYSGVIAANHAANQIAVAITNFCIKSIDLA